MYSATSLPNNVVEWNDQMDQTIFVMLNATYSESLVGSKPDRLKIYTQLKRDLFSNVPNVKDLHGMHFTSICSKVGLLPYIFLTMVVGNKNSRAF